MIFNRKIFKKIIGEYMNKDAEFLKQNGVDVEKSLELFGDMDTYNETIKEFKLSLEKLLPGVRIGIGHAQLPEHELENVIVDFLNREYVFLCVVYTSYTVLITRGDSNCFGEIISCFTNIQIFINYIIRP